MERKLKTTYKYGYPRVDNRVKITKAPLIGFEWEVPINYGDVDDFDDYDGYIEDWYKDSFPSSTFFSDNNSFNYHPECGCLEFASPVGNTISVARRMAKGLIAAAKKDKHLSMVDTLWNQGGIHVSVGDASGERPSREHCNRIEGMLNRKSSYDFIWKFSGRGKQKHHYSEYLNQAKATCWDEHSNTFSKRYTWMLKENDGRLEYRLWCNFPEYLIPAIEFAHSTYIFTKNKKKIPYLKDYKKWLFKQPGYKALKEFEHADWSLTND